MRRLPDFDPPPEPGSFLAQDATSLSAARRGFVGVVSRVEAPANGDLPPDEMERRLLEMGFVEGARLEVLHEGPFGGDPLAVKLDDMRVALRRRDALGVYILPVAAVRP